MFWICGANLLVDYHFPILPLSHYMHILTYMYVCVWLSNMPLPFALTAIDTDCAIALLVEGKGVVKEPPIHGVRE